MASCAHCDAHLPQGSDRCPSCGKATAVQCEKCEFSNPAGFKFCGQCGSPLGRKSTPEVDAEHNRFAFAPEPASPRRAEHRQLTLIFCDLENSVGISHKLGAEAYRALLGPYQQACARCINVHEGRVSRYFGDGVLAIFGFPYAREDDAERALRAALAIVDEVRRLDEQLTADLDVQLRIRIGVATGMVVIGDIIGQGPSEEEAVIGDAVNLAARLQSLAQPNNVLTDQQTRSLVGQLFEFEDHGFELLKGYEEKRQLWIVKRALSVLSRSHAVHKHVTGLLGRELETQELESAWLSTLGRHGELIAVRGDPGVGKSRLIEHFRNSVKEQSSTQIRMQCAPIGAHSAFYPVIELLNQWAGIEAQHNAAERRSSLFASPIAQIELDAKAMELIGHLIGADADPEQIPTEAAQTRQLTFEVLREGLARLCDKGPVLFILEDIQWLDPSTAELLGLIAQDADHRQLLIIATYRSDFSADFLPAKSRTLELSRLDDDTIRRMIRAIPGGDKLSSQLLTQLIERIEGIPLFAEELVIGLLERGGEVRPRIDSIPVVLQASLAARIDRLGSARSAIQAASAIGREIPLRLQARITDSTEASQRQALERGVLAGILQPARAAIGATYSFKHALIQDAAYQSLLNDDRQAIHRKIAECLETDYPALTAERPELLAHHWVRCNEQARAVPWLLEAGRVAARRFHNQEALSHLTRALRTARRLPRSPQIRHLMLEILVERGPVLINSRGVRRAAVRRNYDLALRLCREVDDFALEFAAFWGSLRIDESYSSKLQRAQGLLQLAERGEDPGILLQAHHRQWATVFHMSRLDECVAHAHAGLQIYASGDYQDHGLRYAGHDPKVCGHGELALAYWLQGDADAAHREIEQSLSWANQLEHPGSVAHALDIACMLARYRRDGAELSRLAEQLLVVSLRHQMPEHASKARLFSAWAQIQTDKSPSKLAIEQARHTLEREMNYQLANNTPEDFPVFFESLMEVFILEGKLEQAQQVARQALSVCERNAITYWTPELCRRQAQLERAQGSSDDQVLNWLHRGRAEAQSHGLWSLELRLCLDQARSALARNELKRARELLDQYFAEAAQRTPAPTGPEVELAQTLHAQTLNEEIK